MQGNGMLYMLAMHAATKFIQLPRKPPVTAALIALQTLIHLRPGKLEDVLPTINEVCLNPYFILKVSILLSLSYSSHTIVVVCWTCCFESLVPSCQHQRNAQRIDIKL